MCHRNLTTRSPRNLFSTIKVPIITIRAWREAATARAACSALTSGLAAMTEEGRGRYEALARVTIDLLQSRCRFCSTVRI